MTNKRTTLGRRWSPVTTGPFETGRSFEVHTRMSQQAAVTSGRANLTERRNIINPTIVSRRARLNLHNITLSMGQSIAELVIASIAAQVARVLREVSAQLARR
ncbi:MAG: hypothetical protein ACT4P6_20650 [Gemmatimonadaceae bacterium]